MKANQFVFKSFVKEISAEVKKNRKENLTNAGKFARDVIKDVLDERRKSNPGSPPGKLSGKLQKSINYLVDKEATEAVVGTNDFRAHMLEFGTEKMAPRPFVGVTLIRISPQIKEILSVRWLK